MDFAPFIAGIVFGVTLTNVGVFLAWTIITGKTPLEIRNSAYLSFISSKFQAFNAQTTLKDEHVEAACPSRDLRGKPYITALPKTRPSAQFLALETSLRANKTAQETVSEVDLTTLVQTKRAGLDRWASSFPPPQEAQIESENVNGTEIFWVYWPGVPRDTKKLLFHVHGGSYIAGHPKQAFSQLALLCKLIGCVAVSVNYKRPPENPMPKPVLECVEVYQWLLNEKNYRANSIGFMGESAGGGLNLLCLQRIRNIGLAMPSCSWALAPWADISCETPSFSRNNKYDQMLSGKTTLAIRDFVVGKRLADGTESDEKTLEFNDPSVSPLYGDFTGFPPVYMTVGASEVLLDDSILTADAMFKDGVNVQLDIEPFMCHVSAMMVGLFPEAIEGNCRAAEFFLRHMRD